MQPLKRQLSARIERDAEEISVHEDENAHLWAVSYSDFLMALLAFFILFFSIDPVEKDKLILNLAKDFSSQTGATISNSTNGKSGLNGSGSAAASGSGSNSAASSGGASNSADSNSEAKAPVRVPSSVFQSLANLNIKVDAEKNNLLINFPDDIFQVGQYRLRSAKIETLHSFLTLLKPYEGKVNIYFEGHSDNSPMKIHKNRVVNDNFVLSSLRANAALSLARDFGFSDKHMYIQAASSNSRNSRSLSVRIEPLTGESL